MAKKKIKTLKVVAVQCLSENGKIEANLERALKYVKVAAEKGAPWKYRRGPDERRMERAENKG